MWMLIGLAVLALGFLMSGGKSSDPKVFNDNEVYSTTGSPSPHPDHCRFVIEIFAIMKNQKQLNK